MKVEITGKELLNLLLEELESLRGSEQLLRQVITEHYSSRARLPEMLATRIEEHLSGRY